VNECELNSIPVELKNAYSEHPATSPAAAFLRSTTLVWSWYFLPHGWTLAASLLNS